MEGYFRWLSNEREDIFYVSPSADAAQNLNVPSSIVRAIESRTTNINTIFVPLNPSNNHWTLLVLNMTNRSYFHFDPMYESGSIDSTPVKYIIRTVEEAIKEKFTEEVIKTNPQNSNWECGYHCLMMAYSYGVNRSLPQFKDIMLLRKFLHEKIIDGREFSHNPSQKQTNSKKIQLGQHTNLKAPQLSYQKNSKGAKRSAISYRAMRKSLKEVSERNEMISSERLSVQPDNFRNIDTAPDLIQEEDLCDLEPITNPGQPEDASYSKITPSLAVDEPIPSENEGKFRYTSI